MRKIVFVICSLIGFVIGHYLLEGAAAAYTSSIVSYHLYLGFLVFTSEKRAGFSMPIVQTTFTHLAFLMAVVGLPYLRHYIPFFSIVSLFIPALAPFEADWLFSKETVSKRDEDSRESKLDPSEEQMLNDSTGQDYEAFLQYMQLPHRAFRKNGRGVREEYALWLADRERRKPAAASGTATVD